MGKTFRRYQEDTYTDGKAPSRRHGATSYDYRKAAKQTRVMRQTKRRVAIEDFHSED